MKRKREAVFQFKSPITEQPKPPIEKQPGELTAEARLRCYHKPIEDYTISKLEQVFPQTVQIYPQKYVRNAHHEAFDPEIDFAVSIPLGLMLYERWPTDVHYTNYHLPTEVRAIKGGQYPGIKFEIAAFDADFDKHQEKPTIENFVDYCLTIYIYGLENPPPNIIYQTRGGARLIWVIDPINDPNVFERHYQSMIAKIGPILSRGGYTIDPICKDWTRMFRAPRIVRDGRDEYDYKIGIIHPDKLELCTFKPIPKPKPRPLTGTAKYMGFDPVLTKLKHQMTEGTRNSTLYSACCYTLEKYSPEEAEKWIALLAERAAAAGLPEREIETILKSARSKIVSKQK